VAPVGPGEPYRTHSATFQATAATTTISLAQTAAGDQTVLLDNVRVVPAGTADVRLRIEPWGEGAIQLSWPSSALGFELRSSPNVTGPYTDPGLPVEVGPEESVAVDFVNPDGKQFYQLVRPPTP